MSEPTTPDSGNLPKQMAEAIASHEWTEFPRSAHNQHSYYAECAVCQRDVPRIAEVALAVLGEYPGDVREQLTEKIRASLRLWDAMGITGPPGVTEWDFLAASILAVPFLARLQARAEHAEAGAQLSSERLAEVRQELADVRKTADERQAHIVDLRRRLGWNIEQADKQFRGRREAEAKLREIAMVKVWTNEDGKRFVFADDLAAVLLPAPTP